MQQVDNKRHSNLGDYNSGRDNNSSFFGIQTDLKSVLCQKKKRKEYQEVPEHPMPVTYT